MLPTSSLLGAPGHGCPRVMATRCTSLRPQACQTLHGVCYLSTQTRHPGEELRGQTFECHFPCAKAALLFSFGTLLSKKERSCLFSNPTLFVCSCVLDPVVLLPTREFFPLSLAIIGVKCQVVEDFFCRHSIWLPGRLLRQLCCRLWSYLCSCCMFKSMDLLRPHMLFSFLTFQLLWTFFQELILPCVISIWVQDTKFPWNGFSPYFRKVLGKLSKFTHRHIYDIAECLLVALWHMAFALKATIFSVSSVLLRNSDCLPWRKAGLPPQTTFSLKHLECCLVGNALIWFVLITRGYNRLVLCER